MIFIARYFQKLEDSPSRSLQLILAASFLGSLMGLFLVIPTIVLVAIGAAALFLALKAAPSRRVLWLAIFFLSLALIRSVLINERLLRQEFPPSGVEMLLQGTVAPYPRKSLQGQMFILKTLFPENLRGLNIRVATGMYPEIKVNDFLRFRCKIAPLGARQNPSFDQFAYIPSTSREKILEILPVSLRFFDATRLESPRLDQKPILPRAPFEGQNIKTLASCRTRTITILAPGTGIWTWFGVFRKQTHEKIRTLVAEPFASLLSGLIYGEDAGLPLDVREAFRRSGLSHLVAVSGTNVSVITFTFFELLTAWFFSRRQAAVITATMLGIFLIFVGFEPSVLRAVVMGALILVGAFFGRKGNGVRLLFSALTLMLFISPQLAFLLGFQLSALATFGVLCVRPLLTPILCWLPDGALKNIIEATGAALLMTVPWLAVKLGTIPILAPFANLAVLALAESAFLLGIIFLISSLIITPIAALIAIPLTWLLKALLIVAMAFGSVVWAVAPVSSTNALWLAGGVYGAIAFLLMKKINSRPSQISQLAEAR